MFGGSISFGKQTLVIAQFKDGDWIQVGNLAQSRFQHSTLTFGAKTMIVGASGGRYASQNDSFFSYNESSHFSKIIYSYY